MINQICVFQLTIQIKHERAKSDENHLLDTAEHDGVVTHVDLGREHGLIAARGDKADARENDASGCRGQARLHGQARGVQRRKLQN